MPERIDLMLGDDNHTEDEAISTLSQLARTHGAESHAADYVAASVLAGKFRFSPALGWLEWDGRKWDTDDTAEPRVVEAVRLFIDKFEKDCRVRAQFAEGVLTGLLKAINARIEDESELMLLKDEQLIEKYGTDAELEQYNAAVFSSREAIKQAGMWLNLLSAAKISSITKLCRGMEGVLTRSSAFDAHPDFLNCHNGIVDLRTGELMPSDPDALMTHLAGGEYLPSARSALWDKALEAVEPDCVEWFQTRVGQSATGHTPDDDVLIVAEGGGENGKSAVMSALMRAMGTYGRLISHRVLIAQPGQHPTELMDLRGLRFALLEETPEEGRLDTHSLKVTIGTPQITARKMRRDDVTFDTSHSLWINTNFLPQVDTTDHGTWRRLKAMPWPYRFVKPNADGTFTLRDGGVDREGDLTLKPKLANNPTVPAAVLAWIVEGAGRWYQNERVAPEAPRPVLEATATWRQSSDVGYRFATERLTRAEDHYIIAEVMKTQFLTMLEEEGKKAWSAQTINTRLGPSLEAAGITVERTPATPSKVREGDIQARPGDNVFGRSKDYEAGMQVRMWRGVRFKTDAERNAGHLSVVRQSTKRAADGTDGPL